MSRKQEQTTSKAPLFLLLVAAAKMLRLAHKSHRKFQDNKVIIPEINTEVEDVFIWGKLPGTCSIYDEEFAIHPNE